ncbi:endolytic transglycosylase MltG [Leisingera sp. HS039]|uniref:endolytic transglycosylase MltG n=1 Tax=unclassified Leisingera TaxID=2614906 RepID=UPI00107121B4|nr:MULTISPECIES: endolytic transglycosylase MltG [unclassified Leisingera]MBQ4823404.1 endolytic transglycosylase MltG [Leisingera sp. HS039]QBR36498.1 endolytic transglycosylase MltG [Leisingera sp. NJS201]
MWRSLASNMLTVLIAALFLLGGLILWGKSQYTAEGPLETAICLRVERGSNMARVSRDLESQGAVASAAIFRLGAKYSEKTGQLKAGSFLLEPGSSMERIIDGITHSGASTCGTEIVYRVGVTRTQTVVRELDPATNKFEEKAAFILGEGEVPAAYTETRQEADTRYRIALAEGVTSWQVVEALKAMDVLNGDPGERPGEGLLAPDSYEVTTGTDRAAVLAEMQERQQLRINAAWESRSADAAVGSPEEMLVLASIIEKETGVASERGVVSSVFTNRLNRGMRLQTDPTVIYGVTKGEGVLGRGLRQSELRKATPWNTYVIEGLPPTPIANPGMESLEAAVNPEATDYVFFVADGTGGHAFAETLDEHNRNVAKWREIEAQQQNN